MNHWIQFTVFSFPHALSVSAQPLTNRNRTYLSLHHITFWVFQPQARTNSLADWLLCLNLLFVFCRFNNFVFVSLIKKNNFYISKLILQGKCHLASLISDVLTKHYTTIVQFPLHLVQWLHCYSTSLWRLLIQHRMSKMSFSWVGVCRPRCGWKLHGTSSLWMFSERP